MRVNYLDLERWAEQLKRNQPNISTEALTVDFSENASLLSLHEKLIKVDQFIAIDEKKVEDAEHFYHEIAEKISANLVYTEGEIDIHTQGSAKTRTLIRSAQGELFDIDAICQINSWQVILQQPINFFNQIGNTLKSCNLEVEEKKRCWRIKNPNSGYYIDLTPAISAAINVNAKQYNYLAEYQDSAIYVVNGPTGEWKSSNPKGFSKWVNKQNEFSASLINRIAICNDSRDFSERKINVSIEDVPEQNISSTDFLLLAIRLFKRHRDIKVRQNLIDKESKPISVIISTLLGQCIEALVRNNRTFRSLPHFLLDIAYKLPYLIAYENNNPVIPNPTAPDENFADRWPEDNGKRKRTFERWIGLLKEDIEQLIKTNSKEKLDELFGTTQMPISDVGVVEVIPTTSSRKVPNDGLA